MFLTIGMPTYDDFDGVYFTLQSLKAYHDLEDVELLVVDTKPKLCEDTKKLCESVGASYYHRPDCQGTAPAKNAVFELAKGKFVMCLDCHILLVKDSVKKLKEYLKQNENTKNLIQGPLLYDDQKSTSTHFDPGWRGHMYGTWGNDPRAISEEEFEIPMQGGGLYCCRKDAWPKFHPAFRGFGSEEGYIQEKFRQNGGKAVCLTFLKWIHRFGRPKGVPYPLSVVDRIFNYIVGWTEIGWNHREVINYFSGKVTQEELFKAISDSSKFIGNPTPINSSEKNAIKVKAYVIGRESATTEESFKKIKWTKEKEYMLGANLKSVLEKFIAEGNDYALICKGNLRLEKNINIMIDFWPLIKTGQAKITIFDQINKSSLKTKHSQLSYKIADIDELDDAPLYFISKEFAQKVLDDYKEGAEFSYICEKENIIPFLYTFEENILRLRMQYVPLPNVDGGLSVEAVREIVWAASNSYCLDISSEGLQTTLALCQRGLGVVRVDEYKNKSKEQLQTTIKNFSYENFILTDKEDDFQAPEDNLRTLLINYKGLSQELIDFSLIKQETFLRSKDCLIIVNADQEVADIYKKSEKLSVINSSDDYLILKKL